MKYIIACLFSFGIITGSLAQDNKYGDMEPERCGNFVIYDDVDALDDNSYVEGDGRMNLRQSTTARSEETELEARSESFAQQPSEMEAESDQLTEQPSEMESEQLAEQPSEPENLNLEDRICPGGLSSAISEMEGDVSAKLETDDVDVKIKKEGNEVKYKYDNGDEYKYEVDPDGEVKVRFHGKEEEYEYRKDEDGSVEYEYQFNAPNETLIIEKEADKEAEVKYLYEGKLKDSQFMDSPKFKDLEQGCI